MLQAHTFAGKLSDKASWILEFFQQRFQHFPDMKVMRKKKYFQGHLSEVHQSVSSFQLKFPKRNNLRFFRIPW